MKAKLSAHLLLAAIFLASCSVIRENPKYQFADGKYASKIFDLQGSKVYVHNEDEVINIYPLREVNGITTLDTADLKLMLPARTRNPPLQKKALLRASSFDIDFLTVPFKYRFQVNDFPRQLNGNLNGGVYIGYRTDIFVLHHLRNPLQVSKLRTNRFGFSVGGYSGIGSTAVNPWVSNNQVMMEYDGVVWSKSVVGIIGLNSFSAGLAVGWDHLLDGHKVSWIYQDKPWIGFVFGLNLN